MTDMRKFMILVERVFHGTPHAGIEQFDTKHIGTGEGNQTYGWGLYFASEKQVAEFYQKNITKRDSGKFPSWFFGMYNQRQKHIESLYPNNPAMINACIALGWYFDEYGKEGIDEVMDFINDLPDEPIELDHNQFCTKQDVIRLANDLYIPAKQGALYTVEIPDQSEFLLWDEILLKQSPWVQAVLEKLFLPNLMSDYDGFRDALTDVTGQWFDADEEDENVLKENILSILDQMSGAEFYEVLCKVANINKAAGNPKQKASMLLLSKRIHGIKYKDQMTRSGGAGTYNYVVFDGATTKVVDSQ